MFVFVGMVLRCFKAGGNGEKGVGGWFWFSVGCQGGLKKVVTDLGGGGGLKLQVRLPPGSLVGVKDIDFVGRSASLKQER